MFDLNLNPISALQRQSCSCTIHLTFPSKFIVGYVYQQVAEKSRGEHLKNDV